MVDNVRIKEESLFTDSEDELPKPPPLVVIKKKKRKAKSNPDEAPEKPVKMTKKEKDKKYPVAKKIFKQRTEKKKKSLSETEKLISEDTVYDDAGLFKKRDDDRKKICKAINEKAVAEEEKINGYNKMLQILEGEKTKVGSWAKELKSVSKPIIPEKAKKYLEHVKDFDVLLAIQERITSHLKVLNVAIKDMNCQKKIAKAEKEKIKSIEESLNTFVNQMLSDHQKYLEQSRKNRPMNDEKYSTDTGCLITNIFMPTRYQPGTNIDALFRQKPKSKRLTAPKNPV